MCAVLAADLQCDLNRVNVKATTEQLGFTGRKEGIATEAVVFAGETMMLEQRLSARTPTASAASSRRAADFVVNEDLGFAPCGEGNIFVRYAKPAKYRLGGWPAGRCGRVARNAVTWAGLKDRHAVTEQWFGIHLPEQGEPVSRSSNDNIPDRG